MNFGKVLSGGPRFDAQIPKSSMPPMKQPMGATAIV
jgi:hypothetical protein